MYLKYLKLYYINSADLTYGIGGISFHPTTHLNGEYENHSVSVMLYTYA